MSVYKKNIYKIQSNLMRALLVEQCPHFLGGFTGTLGSNIRGIIYTYYSLPYHVLPSVRIL